MTEHMSSSTPLPVAPIATPYDGKMTAEQLSSSPSSSASETDVFGGGFFGIIDYTVLVLLTILSILVGTVTAVKKNKKNTADDYLLGGRAMGVVPVALSLLGGFVSALSVLGNATEVYFYGTQIFFVSLGCVWGILLVTQLFLPVIYPLQLVSVYEYLQLRFESSLLRRCASMTQIMNTLFYLGMCLYAPCLTLSTVTRIPTWAAIFANGILCTAYVTVGGVRAVVYTDVLQTSLMFLGTVVVVWKLSTDFIGLDEVWAISEKGQRIDFFNLDPSPLVRHTFWSVQVLGAYVMMSYIAFNQAQFQRLISVSSLNKAKGLCLFFLVGLALLWAAFNTSGLLAYAIYADCDPLTAGLIEKKDEIMPFLILDKYGTGSGFVGLFVASVYGGVLSSVSSNANAAAALIWKDFLCDMKFFSQLTDQGCTFVIKLLSAFAGLLSIAVALVIGEMGTLLQISWSVAAAVVSPLDGVFVTAIIAPWVTTKGAVTGFFAAFAFNMAFLSSRLSYGAGRSNTLPLSVDGCPDGVLADTSCFGLNGTSLGLCTSTAENSTAPVVAPGPEGEEERTYMAFFDLSYCYMGFLGVTIVFVVSSFFSVVTGTGDVDVNLLLQQTRVRATLRRLWCRSSFRT
ncbi:sodium-coupled monocarboxylate transporter 2-like isoform X2 [Oratosquilla oratoria]|uniref:sodium-coupled monocarboxylate transporter 2-like isoform X2 n=1 Tax=Oratosquilla oratoria TaxID=337810 RepID=UPI003F75C493